MKEKGGRVFSIVEENTPVKGCTISKQLNEDFDHLISYFSLAKNTEISKESYAHPKLFYALDGSFYMMTDIYPDKLVEKGELVISPVDTGLGVYTKEDAIYLEINIKEEEKVNEILEAGKVLNLKEMLPYKESKIVNMDLIKEDKLKFMLMAFDEGTGLSEHAAPGEALVFALDGQAIIGYEGKEYTIKEGENFKFDKNGKHYVKAVGKFKMALLLTLE